MMPMKPLSSFQSLLKTLPALMLVSFIACIPEISNASCTSGTISSDCTQSSGNINGDITIDSGVIVTLLGTSSINGSTNGSGSARGSVFIGDGTTATNVSSLGNFGSVNSLAGVFVDSNAQFSLQSGNSISANNFSVSGTAKVYGSITSNTTVNSGGILQIYSGGSVGSGTFVLGGTLQNGGSIDTTVSINAGETASLTNSGDITTSSQHAIHNIGTLTALNNFGTISATGGDSIHNDSTGVITNLINTGTITATTGYAIHNNNNGLITNLNNSGSITSTTGNAIHNNNSGTITTFTNSGTITANNGSAIYNNTNGVITSLVNTGTISSSGYTINNFHGSISTITNTGTITSSGSRGIANGGGAYGTINNLQGAGNTSGALTYLGQLPTNYNIIIGSLSQYGRMAVTSGTGTTTFGIYAGGVAGVAASTLNKGTYSSVLSGVTSSNLTGATSGNYNGFTWRLNNSSGSIWDLIVTGASTADTQQSLVNTASVLQNTFTLQNTVLANSLSYDCNVFGANNICVSAGGRNTQVSAANGLNNTSALLIAAYRVMPSVRIGAYADQNLSVNNAGSTVNLGNNTPLIGLFGAWNERLDGTGTEVKVSAAYGQKNATVTRQVVGTSEAGSGSSQLNSQGAQLTAKYGFGFTPDVIVSPYVGVRYTQNNMGGYTEATTNSVTAPLTYSALNTNATTALAGVGAQYRFIPQATAFASAGVETDTNTSNGTYSATGIVGLTPINFNANPVKTRPTATVGAYYDVEKNQRIGITGIYRQEPYQAVQTTTVMATYTVGL